MIVAGACILERLLSTFDLNGVVVSDRGVRWGLVYKEFGSFRGY